MRNEKNIFHSCKFDVFFIFLNCIFFSLFSALFSSLYQKA